MLCVKSPRNQILRNTGRIATISREMISTCLGSDIGVDVLLQADLLVSIAAWTRVRTECEMGIQYEPNERSRRANFRTRVGNPRWDFADRVLLFFP
jgi:hypothetical protein